MTFAGLETLSADELANLVAEQEQLNARLLAAASSLPAPGVVEVAQLREARRRRIAKESAVTSGIDGFVETRQGKTPIRRFPDERTTNRIIHFHGGGWALGSMHEQDAQLAALSEAAGATVVSIGYPLAPESLLPATMETTVAVLAALISATNGQIAVVGESAGAHLALQSILGLPRSMRSRIAAISLTYGIYDLSMTPSQRSWGSDFLGLSTDWLAWFYELALPGMTAEQRRDPQVSPLYADLAGLPPALFVVGERDPLIDDTTFMYQRWLAAGNAAQLIRYPSAPHGFNHQDTAFARRCNSSISSYLA